MDFQKKKLFVNKIVEKITTINKIFKNQMVLIQISYENFANKHKQNIPNYAVSDEI